MGNKKKSAQEVKDVDAEELKQRRKKKNEELKQALDDPDKKKQIEETSDRIIKEISEINEQMKDITGETTEETRAVVDNLQAVVNQALQASADIITELTTAENMQAILEIFPDAVQWVNDNQKKPFTVMSTLLTITRGYDAVKKFVQNNNIKSLQEFTASDVNNNSFLSIYLQTPDGQRIEGKFERPNKRLYLNDKLTNDLPINLNKGDVLVNVGMKGKAPVEIPFKASLFMKENDIVTAQPVDNLDMSYLDVLTTFWVNGIYKFNDAQVYRKIYGSNTHPQKGELEETHRRIDKWRNMDTRYNLHEVAKKWGLEMPRETYEGKMIDLLTRTDENGETYYYQLRPPLNLHYAELTKQIITVKETLRDIRQTTVTGAITEKKEKMSKQRVIIVDYMIKRICIYRNKHTIAKQNLRSYNRRRNRDKSLPKRTVEDFESNEDIIRFDTIFKQIGQDIKTMPRSSRNKYEEFIVTCLRNWIQDGFIKGYRFPTDDKGKAIGVKIVL